MAEILLQLDQVAVKLGAQKVLDNINLSIYDGQHWAITGQSGSGKTVLAHTLEGRHFSVVISMPALAYRKPFTIPL
ncbi:ATP-binding cassette domain-containing protein [Paraflavitalea speifideaquila]|uniref:ATP-binding cassette domain-containing protein n=1 Tax=Paraflavitalea speifideaquila TaxID=3076558 RepID=UPI0028F0B12B|nr:ATP-binding cassette domain-containing protein [Paraflavitalea speifideiaquila]